MKTHLSEGEQGEVLNMATTLEKVKQRRPSDITPLQGMTANVHRMTPLAANGGKSNLQATCLISQGECCEKNWRLQCTSWTACSLMAMHLFLGLTGSWSVFN